MYKGVSLLDLETQLEKIDQLKTDKHMKLLLLGVKTIGSLDNLSEKLLNKHMVSGENAMVNNKLNEFSRDLVDTYSLLVDKFDNSISEAVADYCGFEDEAEEIIYNILWEYGQYEMTITALIDRLKNYAITGVFSPLHVNRQGK